MTSEVISWKTTLSMPLYEYQCDDCGNRFERIQKFSDPPVEKCPKCGGVVRKLISSPAIQFKGSGWYITDYARRQEKTDSAGRNESNEPGSESSAKAEASGGSDAKGASKESKGTPKEPAAGESKPAAKPAAGKPTPGSTS
jgi:putative FmdB family regulatory protein